MPCIAPVSPCRLQKNSKKNLKIFLVPTCPGERLLLRAVHKKFPKFFKIFFFKYLRCLHTLDIACVSLWFAKKFQKNFEHFFGAHMPWEPL